MDSGANGKICEPNMLWEMDGVRSKYAFMLLARIPQEDDPFNNNVSRASLCGVKVERGHRLLDGVVFKMSCDTFLNAREVVNTTLIALNTPAKMLDKTQLKRVQLKGEIKGINVTMEGMTKELREQDVVFHALEGEYVIVGIRTIQSVYPVFEFLEPICFWDQTPEMSKAMTGMDLYKEFESLKAFLDLYHDHGYYHNDVKLNNLLLRKLNDGRHTLSFCDYGAMVHLTDVQEHQTTFPCPWIYLRYPEWFRRDKSLKSQYVERHKKYIPSYDWGGLWDMAVTKWNRKIGLDELMRYNDMYGLGTVFLKLDEQANKLGVSLDESLYNGLHPPLKN